MKKEALTEQTLELTRSRSIELLDRKQKDFAPLILDRVLIIICAYNEEKSLAHTIDSLRGEDILVIDDGSTDETRNVAISHGVAIISHESRRGKAASFADGIAYALQNSYEIVVDVGADAVAEAGSLNKMLRHFRRPEVGGVSCTQIPVGVPNVAYHIDELVWAMLAEGKKLQMASIGSSHLGAVFFAFRPDLVDAVTGSINDDEKAGLSIKEKGYKIVFEERAKVYFDASSCVRHIVQRRKRMYYGHMKFDESMAPSMQPSTSLLALAKTLLRSPRRLTWLPPALLLDFYSRVTAWKDIRNTDASERYTRWVTTYAKNNTVVVRNSPIN